MKANEFTQYMNRSVLLTGSPGGGKSFIAAHFPKPLLVCNFDMGSAITYGKVEDAANIEIDMMNPTENGEHIITFDDHISTIEQGDRTYRTIVLDSLTSFGEDLMRRAQFETDLIKEANRVGGHTPTLADHGLQINRMKYYLGRFNALPCWTIVIAHYMVMSGSESDDRKLLPYLSSGQKTLAPHMGHIFSDVIHCEKYNNGWRYLTGGNPELWCAFSKSGFPEEIKEPKTFAKEYLI